MEPAGVYFRTLTETTSLKYLFPCLLLSLFAGACRQQEKRVVSDGFIDSLLTHYPIAAIAVANVDEMHFWESRIKPALPGYVDESRYAGGLAMDFRFFGEIDSLRKADSILLKVDRDFNHKEASADLGLMAHCLTEHRFMQADSLLLRAKSLGLRPNESLTASFDVDFELGRYSAAQIELNSLRSPDDYGYFFRRSKMDHLKGSLDSAIRDMEKAADLSGSNVYLKGVSLANAGDLYIHSGDLPAAGRLYRKCILLNSADFHSLMGLGWIALVHDHNHSLAARIFRFVAAKNGLPDPLFKLAQMPDSVVAMQGAVSFAQRAADTRYGRMYDKYLIQLYTGILHDPARAEVMANDELNNRATPQTYAWYAWALFVNGKKQEAYGVFEQHVSGQPLEGLELYWMGKMMKGLDKGYNAQAFFKAAYETRYDLGPAIELDLQKELDN
jgi:tetratricopeptide (TPR) repeat protein